MPDVSAHTVIRAAVSEGSGYNTIRRDYVVISDEERERAMQKSPREIVTDLHAEIAAQSPEHAALVAEFERRQARREAQAS